MIFGSCSDLHFTDKIPENRKDSYVDEQFRKFEKMLKIVQKTDSKVLTVGGDFFESAVSPYSLLNRIIRLLNKYRDVKLYVVPGQHDLRYHVSGLANTPLGVLAVGGYISILSNTDVTQFFVKGNKKPLTLIGAGWNEEPQDEADVVVTHRMVTYKEPLWPGQKDYSTANHMFKEFPWAKCIISGDNHKPHVLRKKKAQKLQINCGALMRSTKAQLEHDPCVWLIDSDDWTYKRKSLKALPAEEVFDFAKMEKAEAQEVARAKANEDMDDFIESLSINDKDRPKFKNVLKKVIKKKEPRQSVVNVINEIMEEVGE